MKESPGEYSAFVSYASENREKAEDICASLEVHGFVCWIAPRDVRAGREYADEIIGGIERSACVVLVLSEAANESIFVRREVERAVSKQKAVFPVRIEPVTPSPGLELFISGTHWIDAWTGNWDDHMKRLARDLADGPVGKPVSQGSSGRLPRPERRAFRGTYVAAGLVLLVALSGVGFWSLSRDAPQQTSEESNPAVQAPLPRDENVIATPVPNPSLPARQDQVVPATGVVNQSTPPRSRPPDRTSALPESRASQTPQTPRENTPSPSRPAPEVAPLAPERSRELNEAREDYDNLSIRGGVVDDTLNRLWEQMRPLAPRLDMATRQQSLKTYLTRSKEALTEKDVAGARRYLDIARADIEALEKFLGR